MLGTLKKAGEILSLFAKSQPELGVTEAAEALGIAKSSACAIMSSLAQIGLLRRTPQNRYRLGWRLLELGSILMESTEFRLEALPEMQRLVDRFGETVHLVVLEGFEVVYVAKMEGTRAVRIAASAIGARLPAYCTGVGKVLLAELPWDEVQGYIAAYGMKAVTANTITEPERLKAELELVRQQGFACDLEELVPELCCVAAPVRDYTGQAVAAISLSVPSYRFYRSRDAMRVEVLRAARQISGNLGYVPAVCRTRRLQRCCAKEG